MKTGPRGGLYRSKLKNGMPKRRKPWRQLSNLQRNRLMNLRAMYRAQTERHKYQRMATWVKTIRRRLGKSQSQFAKLMDVSIVTIKRWEGGYGYMPMDRPRRLKTGKLGKSNLKRLTELSKTAKMLRKEQLEFES